MSDETKVVAEETAGLVKVVQAFKVTNIEGVKKGCVYLTQIKRTSSRIEEVLGPIKKQAYATYQEAIKLYNAATRDVKLADEYIRNEINGHLESLKNKPDDLPDGVSITPRWKVEEVDIKALCKAVADGLVSSELIEANMTALNKMASSMKEFMKVPGVTVKEAKSVAIRLKD